MIWNFYTYVQPNNLLMRIHKHSNQNDMSPIRLNSDRISVTKCVHVASPNSPYMRDLIYQYRGYDFVDRYVYLFVDNKARRRKVRHEQGIR